jgi:hypothetical protein
MTRKTVADLLDDVKNNGYRDLTFHFEHIHDARLVRAFEIQGQAALDRDRGKLAAGVF